MIKFYWEDRKKVFSNVGHTCEQIRWAFPIQVVGSARPEAIYNTIRSNYAGIINNKDPAITYGLHFVDTTTDLCYIDERQWYAGI